MSSWAIKIDGRMNRTGVKVYCRREIPANGYFEIFNVLSNFPVGTYGRILSTAHDFERKFSKTNALIKALVLGFGYDFMRCSNVIVFYRTDHCCFREKIHPFNDTK